MNHSYPDQPDLEVNLLFREFAYSYVAAARSWIRFHKLSPDCYRVPFDAVLQRYLSWHERSEKGEWVSLAEFWEELLEEHGFESDRQWLQRQREYLPTARELVMSKYALQIRAPNGKESWRGRPLIEVMHEPEFWEIDPQVDMLGATETEQYRRAHPERFGSIEPTSTPVRRDFWNTEEWDGTPRDPVPPGMTREQYQAKHPILYPPKKRDGEGRI